MEMVEAHLMQSIYSAQQSYSKCRALYVDKLQNMLQMEGNYNSKNKQGKGEC
jgi:hypothetical protein